MPHPQTPDMPNAETEKVGQQARMPRQYRFVAYLILLLVLPQLLPMTTSSHAQEKVRVATFNVAMNRRTEGRLIEDLQRLQNPQAKKVAEIIQRVRPDVLLLNEFDYDAEGKAAKLLQENFLAVSQGGQKPLKYAHSFVASVNTGAPTGVDLDNNGKSTDPTDAYGFGLFPGQYGMLVLSRYPIDSGKVRTFQKFLWRDMPNGLLPIEPKTKKPYYSAEALKLFRLSSKSHWDLPIKIGDKVVHILAAHPTPPVFDGPEDKNGRRNHDEIRFWCDYVVESKASYIYDDNGQRGGLSEKSSFVIAGDLNADPLDGDSVPGAIKQLFDCPRIQALNPASKGGVEQAKVQGKANLKHHGNPAFDTSDFSDRNPGNLRIDYVLPSKNLKVTATGVFWPDSSQATFQLMNASDHRLVWIDIIP